VFYQCRSYYLQENFLLKIKNRSGRIDKKNNKIIDSSYNF
ncbi:hypothetical protein BN863_13190, partial [Formosa agariphila KMM 3901]